MQESNLAQFDYTIKSYEIFPLDVTEEGQHYGLALVNGEFIKISTTALRLLAELKPGISFASVVETLQKKYGLTVTEADLNMFVHEFLLPLNLIYDEEENEKKSPRRSGDTRLWIHIELLDGSKLGWLATPLTILFRSPIVVIVLFMLVTVQFFLVFTGTFAQIDGLILQRETVNIGLIYFILLLSQLFHELGHIVSCYYYGIKPRGLGMGMYLMFPVFFTDMSEAWKLDRRQRLVTDLAGIYFQCITMLVASLWLLFTTQSTLAIIVLSLVWSTLLINLNPVMRFDGYWIFTDLLGIPNVNQYVWQYLKTLLFRRKGKTAFSTKLPRLKPRLKMIFTVYCVIYALGTLLVLTIAVGLGLYLLLSPDRLFNILATLFNALIAGNWMYLWEYLSQNTMYLMAVILVLYLAYTVGKSLVRALFSGTLTFTQSSKQNFETKHT